MQQKYTRLTPELYSYICRHGSRATNPILAKLRGETEGLGDISRMLISQEQGDFMSLLVGAVSTESAIEIGTFTGYSAICIALGLPDNGRLICIDQSVEWTSIARRYWQEAGVVSKIELRIGDGVDILGQLKPEELFDFAFIDADKISYDKYFELLLPHMRQNSLLLFDNMLVGGKVIAPEPADENARALDALNKKLASDPRVESVLLAMADGLNVCRKREHRLGGGARS
jgi:caffeoyl-CoA O-methyltransferase